MELAPLDGREWYRSLCEKLVPQLGEETYLVVAVVGGTNIGKSVIFNHIADARLSATSPLASGTRHPVCVVPEGFASGHDLAGDLSRVSSCLPGRRPTIRWSIVRRTAFFGGRRQELRPIC